MSIEETKLTQPQEEKYISDEEFDRHFNFVSEKTTIYLGTGLQPDILIIKGHLLCEYYLDQIIIFTCKPEEKIKTEDLTYTQKVERLSTSRIIEPIKSRRLSILNKMRNRVGHELEYTLSESDVNSLGYTFGKEYIINKFEQKDVKELLRIYIVRLVIQIAMELMLIMVKYKKEQEEIEKNLLQRQIPNIKS